MNKSQELRIRANNIDNCKDAQCAEDCADLMEQMAEALRSVPYATIRAHANTVVSDDFEIGVFVTMGTFRKIEAALRAFEGGESTNEWISIKDRLPTDEDADSIGDVTWLRSGIEMPGRVCKGVPIDATHWKRSDR